MALNLLKRGHQVYSCRFRSYFSEKLISSGLQELESVSEVVTASDGLITILPDGPDVLELAEKHDGILNCIQPGQFWIDMSSTQPEVSSRLYKTLKSRQINFADAPVSGGVVGAEAASLTIMVGCEAVFFDIIAPLMECMGSRITRVGEPGSGQICKLANQMIVALNIEAVAEALVFAQRCGADANKVHQALQGGFADSRVLEVHGDRMLQNHFSPGFRINLHRKDLNNVLQTCKNEGIYAPATAAVMQMFNSASAKGDDHLDHSALYKVLQQANHQQEKD